MSDLKNKTGHATSKTTVSSKKKKKKSESDSNMTKIWELLEWEFNIIMIKKLKFTEDN